MPDVAVSIKKVVKSFILPSEKHDSIKLKILSGFTSTKTKNTKYEALKGITLDIEKGEFIGILGRNGAGKSTLLKIIAEIYQPTNGSVKVNGKLVPFIELGVGFNPNLSGRDNVCLNGAMFGFSRQEIDEMYDDIVDFAELHDFMDQKLKNYSSGMRVRLAFSVAIKAKSDILLIDEVLAVGDAAFKRKCYEYFNTLKNDGRTIIFVTHNMAAARDYCDRAVVIDDGRIIYDGDVIGATEEYYGLFSAKDLMNTGDSGVYIDKADVDVDDDTVKFIFSLRNNNNDNLDDIFLRCVTKKVNNTITSGFYNKDSLIKIKANSSVSVEFSVPNIFGTGNYMIDVAIYRNKGVDYSDDDDQTEFNPGVILDKKRGVAPFYINRIGSHAPIILPVKVDSNGN